MIIVKLSTTIQCISVQDFFFMKNVNFIWLRFKYCTLLKGLRHDDFAVFTDQFCAKMIYLVPLPIHKMHLKNYSQLPLLRTLSGPRVSVLNRESP